MKTKLKVSRKSLLLTILALGLVAVLAIGGSVAYFTDADEAVNTFTMGKVKIDLDEPGWEEDDGKDLLPGSVRVKDPTVTAVEGQSYMRVRMSIVDGEGNLITNEQQLALIMETLFYDTAYGTDEPNLAEGEKYEVADLDALVTQEKIQREYNHTDFTFAGIQTGNPAVRYYNYNGIFNAETDPPDKAVLFSNVVVPKDWHNEEIFILDGDEYELSPEGSLEVTVKGTGYKVLIRAEAIQSVGMVSAEEAFAALDEAAGITREIE